MRDPECEEAAPMLRDGLEFSPTKVTACISTFWRVMAKTRMHGADVGPFTW